MEDAKIRLAACLGRLEHTELWRRSCIALYGATRETAYREQLLSHMDENSGMNLLFAYDETGDDVYRHAMEALIKAPPADDDSQALYRYQPFRAAWDVRFGGRRDARDIARRFAAAIDQRADRWYRLALVDCVEQMDVQLYEHYRVLADLLLKIARETMAASAPNAADCYLLMKGVRLGLLDPEKYLPRAVESFRAACCDDFYPLALSEYRRIQA